MFLSADEIRDRVESGELVIEPFTANHLKPASYVLRLWDRWRFWSRSSEPIDLGASETDLRGLSPIVTAGDFILSKGDFCLASTIERIALPPNLIGIIAPLSHMGRWGLCVGLGSFIVSPMFGASKPTNLTLELTSHNPSPLRLRAGLPICHLAFVGTTPAREPHPFDRSIFEGRDAPAGPLLIEEWGLLNRKEEA